MIEELELVAQGLAVDKSTWTKFKFGDVAIQQKECVDRDNTELMRYVAGEHMGSEDLHIRNWGNVNEDYLGPAFIRKFEAGDILYGSRRTYLRKVAVAHFDGITANTTFVIKPNEELIIKELLPFVMLSESFTQHSIRNSKGSVNPYINWKDIASFEFLLPPKDQQEQIAELLWAGDELIVSRIKLLNSLEKQLIAGEYNSFYGQESDILKSVILNSMSGGTPDTKNEDFYRNGSIPWITTKILDADFISTGEKYISELSIDNSAAKILPAENIVAGTRVGVGKFSINQVDISFSQDIIGLKIDKQKIDLRFLVYQLNSRVIQSRIKPLLRGTTIKGITKEDLLKLKISIPNKDIQEQIRNKMSSIKEAIFNAQNQLVYSKSLQKTLINQIF